MSLALGGPHTQLNPGGSRELFRNGICYSFKRERKKEGVKILHTRGFFALPDINRKGDFGLSRFVLF